MPRKEMNESSNKISKIALVVSGLTTGGSERVISLLANYWASKGVKVHLFLLCDQSCGLFYKLDPAIHIHWLDLLRSYGNPIIAVFRLLRRLVSLRKALLKCGAQHVISFGDVINIFTGLSLLGTKLFLTVSERSDPHQRHLHFPWNKLRHGIYKRAHGIAAQTQRALDYYPKEFRSNGRVIPNPLDPSLFNQGLPGAMRDANKPVVIAVGRLEYVKGFDMLIQAFGKAAQKYPEWTLKIWGEGGMRPDLNCLIDKLGLSEKVMLCGVTKFPYLEMQRADIFVLSSRYEGFPNALCEAMGNGLPCISFDCQSGPADIIRNGIDGILVPPNDVDSLALHLERLMGDKAEREKLGSRAVEILDRLHIEKIVAEWEDLLVEK